MKTRDRGRVAGGERGFSLTEATISFAVMLTVLLAFTRLMVSTTLASGTQHETTLAKEAARQTIEVLQATAFDQVFALYNGNDQDDPGGPGSAPGMSFDVPGLEPREGDPDGFVGQVLFPTLAAAPGALREDLELPWLGLPADLSGDGQVDDQDHSGDYVLLPVQVRIEWQTARGPARFELKTLLASF